MFRIRPTLASISRAATATTASRAALSTRTALVVPNLTMRAPLAHVAGLRSLPQLWVACSARNLTSTPILLAKEKGSKKSSSDSGAASQEAPAAANIDVPKIESQMKALIDVCKTSFSKFRVGPATPAWLDGIRVGGSGDDDDTVATPLNKLAQISVKDATTLIVNAFDASSCEGIDRALRSSWMQLAPSREGTVFTVPLPKMTKEFRQLIAKSSKETGEKFKVRIRQIRAKSMKQVKDMSHISKDDVKRLENQIHTLSEKYSKQLDELVEAKTKEVLGSAK